MTVSQSVGWVLTGAVESDVPLLLLGCGNVRNDGNSALLRPEKECEWWVAAGLPCFACNSLRVPETLVLVSMYTIHVYHSVENSVEAADRAFGSRLLADGGSHRLGSTQQRSIAWSCA